MPLRAASVIALTCLIIVTCSGSADQRTLARITGTIAALSSAVTVWMRVVHPVNITDPSGDHLRVLAWSLVETVALAMLIVLLVRSAPRRAALVGTLVATLAEAGVALRLVPQWGPGVQAFWVLTWSLAAVSAAALGQYLRTLDARRAQSVLAARQAQRMELASDLHDFVAHDLSGILVQAQAGLVVTTRDPEQAVAALRRIEEATLHALSATDRAIGLLRDDDTPSRDRIPGLEEIGPLVERFSAAVPAVTVTLNLNADAGDGLPREISATAYRIVVEALTNVRRHAADATAVTVDIDRGATLRIQVVNDLGSHHRRLSRAGREGGLGLIGLRERIEALGGTLHTGTGTPNCWTLTATLPVERR
ncbi:sensor histidine kinase [Actinomadura sp. 3N407]|uniref:sensor histidine kinase n=1 Tax=Actinomadura sp. 3N407 TaxID=3457423 RepID=UPI003FCE831A